MGDSEDSSTSPTFCFSMLDILYLDASKVVSVMTSLHWLLLIEGCWPKNEASVISSGEGIVSLVLLSPDPLPLNCNSLRTILS